MTLDEKRKKKRDYMRQWTARNRGKCVARSVAWRRKNPNAFKEWYRKQRETQVKRALKYYYENREAVLARAARRRETIRPRLREDQRRRYHSDPARATEITRRYIANNRAAYNARRRAKYAARPNVRIRNSLCGRLRHALTAQKVRKIERTMTLVGCSMDDFRMYLESKFESGMTWDNYGSVWEVDHIIPCALFDLTKREHQRRCFHFSNLQPLFGVENRKKGCRIKSTQMNLI